MLQVERIDAHIALLATQNNLPKWTLAAENLVFAIVNSDNVVWGPKGKLLYRLFRFAHVFQLELLLLRLIGVLDGIRWWAKAKKTTENTEVPIATFSLFIGYGADRVEAPMWDQYSEENSLHSFHINQTQPESVGRLFKPTLFRILLQIWKQSRPAFVNLNIDQLINKQHRFDYLTSIASRLSIYSFYLEWWKLARAAGLVEGRFITADTSAYASIDVGVPSDYYAHGLLSKYVLFPEFKKIVVKTRDEKDYLQKLLHGVDISHCQPRQYLATFTSGVIMITSTCAAGSLRYCYESLSDLEYFFNWAKQRGLNIIVRLHRREDGSFWHRHFPGVAIDKGNEPFLDSIIQLKPLFVVSWASTTLVEAALNGIIPITFSLKCNSHVQELVYPLHRRCLKWPEDEEKINDASVSDKKYNEILDELTFACETI